MQPGGAPADPGAAASLARADGDMAAVLRAHMALGPRPIETLTPQEARMHPRISLVRADLRGMPPTTIILTGIDPLRPDGEELGARLREAGVPVQVHAHPDVTHEFFGTGAVVRDAGTAVQQAAAGLRSAFGR